MIKRYLLIIGLIIFAVTIRLLRAIPNVEVVTLVTFLAAFYLGKKEAVIVALSSMAISDVIIGNTNISLFTWSAYGMIAIGAGLISHLERSERSRRIKVIRSGSFSASRRIRMTANKTFLATLGGLVATFWFYLWTNFGVWFLDSWGMYPKTLNGLILCYVNGLPFLRNQLVGNLIIVPVGFFIIEIIIRLNYLYKLRWLYKQGLIKA